MESGFNKVSAFIELFRKHYGQTPGAYKRGMISGRLGEFRKEVFQIQTGVDACLEMTYCQDHFIELREMGDTDRPWSATPN